MMTSSAYNYYLSTNWVHDVQKRNSQHDDPKACKEKYNIICNSRSYLKPKPKDIIIACFIDPNNYTHTCMYMYIDLYTGKTN